MQGILDRPQTILELFPVPAMGRLTNAITQVIDKSFHDSEGRMAKEISRAEIKDRFNACFKMAKELRGDLHWGLERIIGQLEEILRCHLAKAEYVPADRKCWVPQDGSC